MSIGNMPEDELDALFQKAASEYNPEFNPEAWQAMEKKLDAPLVPRVFNWRRFSRLFLFVFLMSIGTWMGYTQYNKSVRIKQPTVITRQTPITDLQNEGIAAPEPGRTKGASLSSGSLPVKENLVSAPTGKTTGKTGSAVAPAKKYVSHQSQLKKRSEKVVVDVNKTLPIVTTPTHDPVTARGKTGAVPSWVNAPTPGKPLPAADLGEKRRTTAEPVVTPDSSQAPAVALPATNTATDSVDNTDKAAAKEKNSLYSRHRFTLSLVAAPDLTAVGFSDLGGISTNAGALVGYNFTSKWRFTTGVIRARKVYTATPDDYGNEYEFWHNRHKPDDIEAVCQVLDIPVNIGYQVWHKGANNIILNTGLSSYLMRREKYTYEYYPYGGSKGYTSNWQVKNQNKHWFSMYNLSVGYGRQLLRGMHVGVEPFIKMPLAGVGAGKIKLASAGVFFSVSYTYPP